MRVNKRRVGMGLIVQANKLWEVVVVNLIRAMVMVVGAMGVAVVMLEL